MISPRWSSGASGFCASCADSGTAHNDMTTTPVSIVERRLARKINSPESAFNRKCISPQYGSADIIMQSTPAGRNGTCRPAHFSVRYPRQDTSHEDLFRDNEKRVQEARDRNPPPDHGRHAWRRAAAPG